MVISLSTVKEFTPEWNGNKACDNPIVIKHKAPTMDLYNRLIPKPTIKLSINPDGSSAGGETEMTIDNTKLVKEMVISIANLEIEIDGKTTAVVGVADLLSPNSPAFLSGLVDEIGTHFQTILSKKVVDEKN